MLDLIRKNSHSARKEGPLGTLIAKALEDVGKRKELRERIAAAEQAVADAAGDLAERQAAIDLEEYESAQGGRLATASPRTIEARNDAELKLKTQRLRLRGLEHQMSEIEGELLSAGSDITEAWKALEDARIQECAERFSKAAEQVQEAVDGATVLTRSLRDGRKFPFWGMVLKTLIWHPGRGEYVHGTAMAKPNGALDIDAYLRSAKTRELHQEFMSLRAQIDPIEKVVQEIKGG